MRRLLGLVVVAFAVAVPPASAAAAPHYVAVVISSPQGTATACVRWTGTSGAQVLGDAVGGRLVYRRDGVLVQINGYPASATADDTHFWSYWYDTGSSWRYSELGPNARTPPAGTVEGWSYDDGGAHPGPPARSAAGLYATLCGARDRPPVHSSTAPKPAPQRTTHPRTSVAPAPRVTTSPTATKRPHRHHRKTRARPAPPSGSAAVITPAPQPAPTEITPAAAARPSSSASNSAWPTALTIAAVAALGGAGAWLAARRRRAG